MTTSGYQRTYLASTLVAFWHFRQFRTNGAVAPDADVQYERGSPSECSATKFRIISLETGPMLSMRTSQK
jgi:hypothetical protein